MRRCGLIAGGSLYARLIDDVLANHAPWPNSGA